VEILQTSLDDESEQANREITAAKQESESLRRQLQVLKQDLAKADATIAGAQAQIEAFQSDYTQEERSRPTWYKTKGRRNTAFQVRTEKQNLQISLLQSTSKSLTRTSKASVEAERDEMDCHLKAMKQQERRHSALTKNEWIYERQR